MDNPNCKSSDTESLLSDDSFRFLLPQVGDSEGVELYRPGGFHPVQLGDLYDDDRYRIVHKIGSGGFSTVWLTRDASSSTWVVLKIVVADRSATIEEKAILSHGIASKLGTDILVTYSRYFHIDGPNGRHLCLVQPFLGPSIYALSRYMETRLRPQLARDTALRTAKALAELHSHGLCHGDLTPSNVVFRIHNLDHFDDKAIYRLFGEPNTAPLETEFGEGTGAEAPRYIVGYLDFTTFDDDILQDDICLIDFDQMFLASDAPRKLLGIPSGYLAPEAAVGQPASPASDVWALGCTILHARSGSSPFSIFGVDCAEDQMRLLVQYMGGIPASWGQSLFDKHGSDHLRKTPRKADQ